MTNYNERLDEVFSKTKQVVTTNYSELSGWSAMAHIELTDEARQAFTSLIKELVAEAKPNRSETQQGSVTVYGDLNERDLSIINQFEQNLLKALEDKNV